jgi:hypothetical protein
MVAKVYPPKQVALVGAGNGAGSLVQWLHNWTSDAGQCAPVVTLLEPHAPSMAQLAKRLAEIEACADWQLLPDMLAPAQGEHVFYQYSLAAENSLLPLDALRPLWPGLLLQSESFNESVELASLLPACWLLVDCLPAANLLQSTRLPASTQVVLARVLLANDAPSGASLTDVHAVLKGSGFKSLAVFAERNSAIGKALFVRDPEGLKDHIDQLAQEKAQVQHRYDELTKAKEAETAAKLAATKANAELQSQLEKSKQSLQAEVKAKDQTLAQVLHRYDELTKAKEAETAAKLAATKANAELQSQLEKSKQSLQAEVKAKVTEAKDALEKAMAAAEVEKMLLSKEKVELVVAKGKVEKLANERQAKIKLLEQRLQILQANMTKVEDRYRSLEAELLKAEAQIELIKVFVLQAPAQ